MLWGAAAIGFGAWHLVDGILSHWLIGRHRIKMDSPTPLVWDLIWFVVFGIVPVVLGLRMLRDGHGGPGGGTRAAAALAVATLIGGPLAALPAKDSDQVMVLFAPGISAARLSTHWPVPTRRCSGPTAPAGCGRSNSMTGARPGSCIETARCSSAIRQRSLAAWRGRK